MNIEQNHLYAVLALSIVFILLGLFFYYRRKKILDDAQIRSQTKTQTKTQILTHNREEISPPKILNEQDRTQTGLQKSKLFFAGALDRLFLGAEGEKFYDTMEELLITADIGVSVSEKILDEMKLEWGMKKPEVSQMKNRLKEILKSKLPQPYDSSNIKVNKPQVIMIVGVNGAGKTTTIAKLAQRFKNQNLKIIVAAADTYRAAANEQLKIWVDRIGVEGVFQAEGADPSAVAFDTVKAAQSRNSDVCIVDTAGRLHTKSNLMDELKKMKRVIEKAMPGAPHEVWLVIDGTFGQNAFNQAHEFNQALGLTGLVVTKLDGTSKGGAVIGISSQLKTPVKFIGVGETPEDLVEFKADLFVESIFS